MNRALAIPLCLLVAGAAMASSPAFAQPKAPKALDPAEKLFEEGRVAMAAQDFVTACARFEASHRLSPGGGVLANLGDCEERRGRLIASRDAFKSAAELFTKAEKKQYALERAAAVERTIPKLTVQVAEPLPAELTISVDDKAVAPKAVTLLDPGHYTVVVRAPKYRERTYPLDLRPGESRVLTTVALEPLDAPAASPLLPMHVDPPPPVESDKPSPIRTAGFVVGGLGVVGLGVGAVTGILALGSASTVKSSCNTDVTPATCKTQEGLDAMSSGQTTATVSTIGFIGGGALLTAGLVMILTAPKSASKLAIVPTMGPGNAGLVMWRSF